MIQISLETREKITTEKREYKREMIDVTRTEIFLKTMVVRTVRAIKNECYDNRLQKKPFEIEEI